MNAFVPHLPWATLRRGLTYGLLFGVVISASESLALPLGSYASMERVLAMWPIFASWVLCGTLIACSTMAVERWLDRGWKLALTTLLLAIAWDLLNSVWWTVINRLGAGATTQRVLGITLPSLSSALYGIWMTLFYGGLFVIACVLVTRSERHRQLLASAQIARHQTEALLDAAELDALRGQIDPAFLLRALAAVQSRYDSDAAGADRLLDQLVAFLRSAMPGVRSGCSTLAAEVALARAYAQLDAAINPGGPAWRVEGGAALPEMPFPPLWLLPVMDGLTSVAAIAPRSPGRLRVKAGRDGALEIVLVAPGGCAAELCDPLRYRLQVALRATFGNAASLYVRPATARNGAALALRIDAPFSEAVAHHAAPEARAPPGVVASASLLRTLTFHPPFINGDSP